MLRKWMIGEQPRQMLLSARSIVASAEGAAAFCRDCCFGRSSAVACRRLVKFALLGSAARPGVAAAWAETIAHTTTRGLLSVPSRRRSVPFREQDAEFSLGKIALSLFGPQ